MGEGEGRAHREARHAAEPSATKPCKRVPTPHSCAVRRRLPVLIVRRTLLQLGNTGGQRNHLLWICSRLSVRESVRFLRERSVARSKGPLTLARSRLRVRESIERLAGDFERLLGAGGAVLIRMELEGEPAGRE